MKSENRLYSELFMFKVCIRMFNRAFARRSLQTRQTGPSSHVKPNSKLSSYAITDTTAPKTLYSSSDSVAPFDVVNNSTVCKSSHKIDIMDMKVNQLINSTTIYEMKPVALNNANRVPGGLTRRSSEPNGVSFSQGELEQYSANLQHFTNEISGTIKERVEGLNLPNGMGHQQALSNGSPYKNQAESILNDFKQLHNDTHNKNNRIKSVNSNTVTPVKPNKLTVHDFFSTYNLVQNSLQFSTGKTDLLERYMFIKNVQFSSSGNNNTICEFNVSYFFDLTDTQKPFNGEIGVSPHKVNVSTPSVMVVITPKTVVGNVHSSLIVANGNNGFSQLLRNNYRNRNHGTYGTLYLNVTQWNEDVSVASSGNQAVQCTAEHNLLTRSFPNVYSDVYENYIINHSNALSTVRLQDRLVSISNFQLHPIIEKPLYNFKFMLHTNTPNSETINNVILNDTYGAPVFASLQTNGKFTSENCFVERYVDFNKNTAILPLKLHLFPAGGNSLRYEFDHSVWEEPYTITNGTSHESGPSHTFFKTDIGSLLTVHFFRNIEFQGLTQVQVNNNNNNSSQPATSWIPAWAANNPGVMFKNKIENNPKQIHFSNSLVDMNSTYSTPESILHAENEHHERFINSVPNGYIDKYGVYSRLIHSAEIIDAIYGAYDTHKNSIIAFNKTHRIKLQVGPKQLHKQYGQYYVPGLTVRGDIDMLFTEYTEPGWFWHDLDASLYSEEWFNAYKKFISEYLLTKEERTLLSQYLHKTRIGESVEDVIHEYSQLLYKLSEFFVLRAEKDGIESCGTIDSQYLGQFWTDDAGVQYQEIFINFEQDSSPPPYLPMILSDPIPDNSAVLSSNVVQSGKPAYTQSVRSLMIDSTIPGLNNLDHISFEKLYYVNNTVKINGKELRVDTMKDMAFDHSLRNISLGNFVQGTDYIYLEICTANNEQQQDANLISSSYSNYTRCLMFRQHDHIMVGTLAGSSNTELLNGAKYYTLSKNPHDIPSTHLYADGAVGLEEKISIVATINNSSSQNGLKRLGSGKSYITPHTGKVHIKLENWVSTYEDTHNIGVGIAQSNVLVTSPTSLLGKIVKFYNQDLTSNGISNTDINLFLKYEEVIPTSFANSLFSDYRHTISIKNGTTVDNDAYYLFPYDGPVFNGMSNVFGGNPLQTAPYYSIMASSNTNHSLPCIRVKKQAISDAGIDFHIFERARQVSLKAFRYRDESGQERDFVYSNGAANIRLDTSSAGYQKTVLRLNNDSLWVACEIIFDNWSFVVESCSPLFNILFEGIQLENYNNGDTIQMNPFGLVIIDFYPMSLKTVVGLPDGNRCENIRDERYQDCVRFDLNEDIVPIHEADHNADVYFYSKVTFNNVRRIGNNQQASQYENGNNRHVLTLYNDAPGCQNYLPGGMNDYNNLLNKMNSYFDSLWQGNGPAKSFTGFVANTSMPTQAVIKSLDVVLPSIIGLITSISGKFLFNNNSDSIQTPFSPVLPRYWNIEHLLTDFQYHHLIWSANGCAWAVNQAFNISKVRDKFSQHLSNDEKITPAYNPNMSWYITNTKHDIDLENETAFIVPNCCSHAGIKKIRTKTHFWAAPSYLSALLSIENMADFTDDELNEIYGALRFGEGIMVSNFDSSGTISLPHFVWGMIASGSTTVCDIMMLADNFPAWAQQSVENLVDDSEHFKDRVGQAIHKYSANLFNGIYPEVWNNGDKNNSAIPSYALNSFITASVKPNSAPTDSDFPAPIIQHKDSNANNNQDPPVNLTTLEFIQGIFDTAFVFNESLHNAAESALDGVSIDLSTSEEAIDKITDSVLEYTSDAFKDMLKSIIKNSMGSIAGTIGPLEKGDLKLQEVGEACEMVAAAAMAVGAIIEIVELAKHH